MVQISEEPAWWRGVQSELHGDLSAFSRRIRDKYIDIQLNPIRCLRRKNPFLYRIRGCDTPQRLAEEVVNAVISSSEETMFGEVLEQVAISVARAARQGRKSSSEAIDIEWDETVQNRVRVLVQVKSGPNWGNSEQRRRMIDSFRRATQAYRSNNPNGQVSCVEGCCYGKNLVQELGTHRKIVGMEFWKFISRWDQCSFAIMDLLGEFASNGLSRLKRETMQQLEQFLIDEDYVTDGLIDWQSLHQKLAS